jgi:hypothetical protein
MSERRPSRHELEARRNAGTCLALVGLLAIAAGLFYLVVIIMPDLALAVVFLAVLAGFVLFHYVTWGWLLSRPRPGDEQFHEPETGARPYESSDHVAELGDD